MPVIRHAVLQMLDYRHRPSMYNYSDIRDDIQIATDIMICNTLSSSPTIHQYKKECE